MRIVSLVPSVLHCQRQLISSAGSNACFLHTLSLRKKQPDHSLCGVSDEDTGDDPTVGCVTSVHQAGWGGSMVLEEGTLLESIWKTVHGSFLGLFSSV